MPQQTADVGTERTTGGRGRQEGHLRERIQEDLRRALKGGDSVRVRTLRLLEAAVTNEEIAKKRMELTGDDLLRVLEREVKRRHEAAEAYRAGGREDRARAELDEAEVLAVYAPPQLTDGDLERIVSETLSELGMTSKANADARDKGLGKAVGAVMAKVRGRAEGSRVREIVSKTLGKTSEGGLTSLGNV